MATFQYCLVCDSKPLQNKTRNGLNTGAFDRSANLTAFCDNFARIMTMNKTGKAQKILF